MGANIKIQAERQDFKQGMQEVVQNLKRMKGELDLTGTQIKAFGADSNSLRQKQELLGNVIKEQTGAIDKYKKAIAKLTTDIAQYKNRNTELSKTIEETENKLKESIRTTGETSKETKDLQKELKGLQREYKNNSKATNKAENDINKFKGQMTEAEKEIINSNKALEDTNEELNKMDTGKAGKAIDSLKGKMNDFRTSIKTKLLVGIAGIGTAMVATAKKGIESADEMHNALNGLSAQTGITGKDLDGMKDILTDIYNDNFGESFDDIAQSMAQVHQQTGLTGEKLKDTTENALLMRDTFDFDVNESMRASSMLVNQFGMDGDQAFNLIAQGAQSSLNKNDDLLDTINEYSNQFHDAGFSAEEMFNMLQNGAKAGGFSIDKMGDAIKEFTIRTKDGSDGTKQAFTDLGLNADDLSKKFAKGGKSGKEAFQQVNKKLFELKDPLKQGQVGVQLYGTMWEDMGAKGIKALSNLNGDIKKSKDALNQINDVKYDSFGSAMEGLKRQLTTSFLIPLGEQLLPKLNELGNWVLNNQGELKEYAKVLADSLGKAFKIIIDLLKWIIDNKELVIGGLIAISSVKMGSSIVNFGKDLKKATGLLKIFTKTAPSVAGAGAEVAETATAGAGAFSGLGGAIGGTLIKLTPWALGIATVGAGLDAVNKGMKQDSIPTTDLFNKKMNENTNQFQANMNKVDASKRRNVEFTKSTKKNVGELMKSNNTFQKSLMGIYTNSTKLTNKYVQDMMKKYTKMGTDIKKEINKKYKERLKSTQEYFKKDKTLTDKEKAKVLKDMEVHHKKELKSIDTNNNNVLKVLQKASKEHRNLTKEEMEQIQKYQEQQRKTGIEKLSSSEKESKEIMNRLKEYGTRITAEQAGNIIENAEKQRKESVGKANKQFAETKKTIENMRDVTHSISADQAEKMIKEAERTKKESIKKADAHKEGVIGKIRDMNSDVLKKIDTADGSILDKWDALGKSMKDIKRTVTTVFKTIGKAVANYASSGSIFGGGSLFSGSLWDSNWTGTDNFRGGLTKMHDSPGGGGNWELYSLPGGSPIYNHDASEAMVKETAKEVAEGVLKNSQQSGGGLHITIEKFINNRKQDVESFGEELNFIVNQNNLGTGGAY